MPAHVALCAHLTENVVGAARRLPTLIVSFETHQIYCIRNALTGAIAEGDEDDIRSFHYLWALQPNEQSGSEHPWQVTELAIRGVMEVY